MRNLIVEETKFKQVLTDWVCSHPDVFQSYRSTNSRMEPSEPFWWVQNCLGELLEWPDWFMPFITKLSMTHRSDRVEEEEE